jgi:hypothetical protein
VKFLVRIKRWLKRNIVVLFLCLIAVGYVYLHPSSEKMSCDNSLVCHVERKYLGVITINKDIKLSSDSKLYGKLSERVFPSRNRHVAFHRNNTYVLHIILTDNNQKPKRPFVFYYIGMSLDSLPNDGNSYIAYEIQGFNQYLKNPSSGYYLEPVSANVYIIFVIAFTLIVFCAYYIFNFIEDLINKLLKNK